MGIKRKAMDPSNFLLKKTVNNTPKIEVRAFFSYLAKKKSSKNGLKT